MELFIEAHPRDLPPDAERQLIAFGEEVFAQHADRPAVRAFWWPRFLRVARWFLEVERERRERGCRPHAWEAEGSLTLETGAGPFTLTCIADRIDRDPADGFEIIDYKTGRTPTKPQVESGFSPQLPLEAAVLRAGGFEKLAAGEASALAYWKMSGGREAGKITSLDDARQLPRHVALIRFSLCARHRRRIPVSGRARGAEGLPPAERFDGGVRLTTFSFLCVVRRRAWWFWWPGFVLLLVLGRTKALLGGS